MTIAETSVEQIRQAKLVSARVLPEVIEVDGFRYNPAEIAPNIDHIITEDDTPVDNFFSEKQQRLLTEALYASWAGPGEGRPFLAMANVGLFYMVFQPPLVLDVLLSLDVQAPDDPWPKQNRSYFVWEYGKPPNVVIEIVSNREGQEDSFKLRRYAEIGVTYYAIFDPAQQLSTRVLRLYGLRQGVYVEMDTGWLEGLDLGLALWDGSYEGLNATWLRWVDEAGAVIASGAERAEQERQRAEQEHQRAERLVAQLRALGVEPTNQDD